MYQLHPSPRLKELFASKPYQGANPAEAKFLFIGLDANYDRGIETSGIFSSLLEYHDDGVAFWQRTGLHHPFLLDSYGGDGRRYHEAFSRIGFGPQHAHLVSFIELLHLPTVGKSKLRHSDLQLEHLAFLNEVVLQGKAEHIFLPSSVLVLLRRSRRWVWAKEPGPPDPLPVVHRSGRKSVYQQLHLSYQYGRIEQLRSEARAIARLIARHDAALAGL